MKIGHYKTLDIEHTASAEEIKKAFYKLAHIHHPDKGGKEETFKIINGAYQILSNPERRRQYDLTIRVERPFEGGFQRREYDFNGFNIVYEEWNWGTAARTGWNAAGPNYESQNEASKQAQEDLMRMYQKEAKIREELMKKAEKDLREFMRRFNGLF